jgi:hypothetical protein
VYCWLYPYRPIVVARDFTFVDIEGQGGKSPGMVSIIEFFPVAFCVVDGDGSLDDGPVTALHPFSADADDVHRDVAIWRQPMLRPGFPERTYGNHMVMGGRTYADSVTTVGGSGFKLTNGKQVQAEAWDGGDPKNIFNGLHAFVEIPET